MELEQLSGTELGYLVNTGSLNATEIVQYFADRIEARNPSINAFTYTRIEEALQDARWIDQQAFSGKYLGPFAGVPVALKDFLPSKKGWTNSHGGVKSLIATDDADSEFWSAARHLGAIAIGKTNAPAFGFSGACQNKLYGKTSNPFDLSRTSGGSSGGSGAAVADGLVPFAEGGDAGGSIRIPAGWCNLFGFKASLGTIPSRCRPDGWAATHPYCVNGALTNTVLDAATLLDHMAHYDRRDPMSLPINATKRFRVLINKPIKGMKIAYTRDFDLYPVDPKVRTAVWTAVKKLEDAGATITPVSFEWKHSLDEMMRCWAWAISVDTALDLAYWKANGLDLVKDHRDELPEEFIYFNEIASKASIFDMRTFNEIRTDILDNFEDKLDQYDAIISPTAACLPMPHSDNGRAIEIDGVKMNPELNFISFAETALVNFIGYPAASVPAGLVDDHIPVGMQIIGKQYHDEDVLAISRTFEEIQPWRKHYEIPFNRLIK